MSEIPNPELVMIGVRVPPDLHRKIHEIMRAEHFASISEYVRELLRHDVERHESQPSTVEAGS